jgi:hypothetical protein
MDVRIPQKFVQNEFLFIDKPNTPIYLIVYYTIIISFLRLDLKLNVDVVICLNAILLQKLAYTSPKARPLNQQPTQCHTVSHHLYYPAQLAFVFSSPPPKSYYQARRRPDPMVHIRHMEHLQSGRPWPSRCETSLYCPLTTGPDKVRCTFTTRVI